MAEHHDGFRQPHLLNQPPNIRPLRTIAHDKEPGLWSLLEDRGNRFKEKTMALPAPQHSDNTHQRNGRLQAQLVPHPFSIHLLRAELPEIHSRWNRDDPCSVKPKLLEKPLPNGLACRHDP